MTEKPSDIKAQMDDNIKTDLRETECNVCTEINCFRIWSKTGFYEDINEISSSTKAGIFFWYTENP